MLRARSLGILGSLVWLAGSFPIVRAAGEERPIDYNRDVRPILSNNCYQCHGPDPKHREAGLRLDERDAAFKELDSGSRAIAPGKVKESALVERILSKSEGERMPPPSSGKALTPKQIETLANWVAQGAEWKPHWAFVKPVRPAEPKGKHASWVRNPIDRFIAARLDAEGLSPSPEADKPALIRRVTYDLTGLPPTLAEIDAFLDDNSPNAYEKVVDRLLASPRYGEHMARYWLDAARYGDSHGLHLDNERAMWPYRDWVIGAFNRNLPFDQFTIDQLAGDLRPSPTLDQRVASGFNRCNVTTSEGGAIDEEFLVRYAVDRTEAVGTVWLGMTIGCAVCHDHKFDPISQKEFYRLYAHFNSLADPAMDGNSLMTPPIVRIPSQEQTKRQQEFNRQIAETQQKIKTELAKVDYVEPKTLEVNLPAGLQEYVWIEDGLPLGAKASADGDPSWQFVSLPDPVLSGSRSSTQTAQGRAQHFFTDANPPLRLGEGDKLFAYIYLDPKNPPKEVMLQWNDGSWEHRAYWGSDLIDWGQPGTASRLHLGPLPSAGQWVRLEVEAAKVGLKPGAMLNGWAFTQFDGRVWWDKAGVVTRAPQGGREAESLLAWEHLEKTAKNPSVPEPVRKAIETEPGKRTADQTKLIRDHYLEFVCAKTRSVFDPLHARIEDAKKKLAELEAQIPACLVSQELATPRDAFLLKRGDYDKRLEKVARGVPAIFPPMPKGAPSNRMGLAQWLVDPSHPLTARVTVNRFWQQYFGTGIVKTAEDFGIQGEWPSHPQLLDWLATEFIARGWDVKAMQRLIVTSATYRQSSRVTPELVQKDPENRLLARGPRFRMDAEMVRDTALSLSGLLVGTIGGKSVKPYQPSGLWEAISYPTSSTAKFVQDHGDALYRRSMYTFWKRTSPPPTMLLFDAPSRETCIVRRPRTNTPVAALALLNDVQFFEAARALGQRMVLEGGAKPEERVRFAFRLATARLPSSEEAAALVDQYKFHLAEFQHDKQAALKVVSQGESKRNESLDVAELAAWTLVANTILNLDETITKG